MTIYLEETEILEQSHLLLRETLGLAESKAVYNEFEKYYHYLLNQEDEQIEKIEAFKIREIVLRTVALYKSMLKQKLDWFRTQEVLIILLEHYVDTAQESLCHHLSKLAKNCNICLFGDLLQASGCTILMPLFCEFEQKVLEKTQEKEDFKEMVASKGMLRISA